MPIDSYALCPCGTGKKIKFCCPDLLKELEQIQEMLEGEQRMACLQYIEGLAPEIQQRASILATKALIETQLGETEKLEKTIALFLEKHPENPIALAEKAMLSLAKRDVTAGVEELQHAIQMVEQTIPQRVYEGIGIMGQVLISANHPFAGRAHLSLQAVLAGEQDPRPAKMLNGMNSDPAIPLILKDDPQLAECPEGAAYKGAFEEAMQLGLRGAWLVAGNQLSALAAEHPDSIEIWRNIATFYSYSARDDQAIAALRKIAELSKCADERIESEALAQFMDGGKNEDMIAEIVVTLPVTDMDSAHPQLLASRQAAKMQVDMNQFAKDDQPPPKDVFWVLDRDSVEADDKLTHTDIPLILGEIYLFGRETDREARIELVIADSELDQSIQCLKKIIGDALQDPIDQKVIGQITKVEHALKMRMKAPEGISRETFERIQSEKTNHVYLEVWPGIEQKKFGGKNAIEAAKDPQLQQAVAGSILLMELNAQNQVDGFDFNQLRSKVGLPANEPVDPATIDLDKIPLIRISRLQMDKLSTDYLLRFHSWCAYSAARGGLYKITEELLKRDDYDKEKIKKSELYGILAEISLNSDQALEYLQQAIASTKEEGGYLGQWYLRELTLRISRGDQQEAQELLRVLQTDHIDEPGVAQALYSLMAQLGLIDPAQMQAMAAMQQAAGGSQDGMFIPGAGQPTAPPPPAEEEKKEKSGLWLPGD